MCSVSLFVSWHISSIEYFSPFDPLSILLVIYASSPSDILINPCLAVLIPTASAIFIVTFSNSGIDL